MYSITFEITTRASNQNIKFDDKNKPNKENLGQACSVVEFKVCGELGYDKRRCTHVKLSNLHLLFIEVNEVCTQQKLYLSSVSISAASSS